LEQKKDIDGQMAEIRQMLDGGPKAAGTGRPPEAPKGKRRKMSAAARKRISDAQRNNGLHQRASLRHHPHRHRKPKHKLSAAGRKAIRKPRRKMGGETGSSGEDGTSRGEEDCREKGGSEESGSGEGGEEGAVKKTAVKKAAKAPEQAAAEVAAQ
jgi:hypothetical protein